MTRIAAVILAGGKGERLGGRNKALIEIGGGRLIDRAVAVVSGCHPILLSTGARDFTTEGVTPVADLPGEYGGPLAGIAAAVSHLADDRPDLLLSLAVDTPLFPTDFLSRALRLVPSAPAVIAMYGGQDYPTNGLWRFDAIADLAEAVRQGRAPRSLRRLGAGIGAAFLDYSALTPKDPFRNVNTPQDLTYFLSEG